MSFFADEPVDVEQAGDEDEPEVESPWEGAPKAEIPVVLPVSALLVSNDQVALVLSGVRVFSDGVEFSIEVKVRRAALSEDDWDELLERARGFSHRRTRRSTSRLRVGVLLADASKLVSGDWGRSPEDGGPKAQLVQSGGSGSGSDRFWVSSWDFWLWPLPSEGPLTVVVDWPQLGLAEGTVVVDGGDLASAARRARPIWSEAGPLNGGPQPSWSISFKSPGE